MKKSVSILTAILIASATVTPLFSGCGTSNSGWNEFKNEALAENEVRVNVRDGECYLRWAQTDGAESYNLYRSESRFGKYYKVSDDAVKENRYSTENGIYCYYKITANVNGEEIDVGEPVSAFSQNSLIINHNDDMTAVQNYIDEMHNGLESGSVGQFSSTRFAMMFLKGEYPEIEAKTGYYTSVIGLGEVPADVNINSLYVSTNVLSNNNSTCTFWRSVENVCVNSDTQWAVSQATSMRRVQINGNLALSHPTGYSSGGFLANSKITGKMNAGTQQQWMSRNDQWNLWPTGDGSHNLVFSGCEGQTPNSVWNGSAGRYSNIEYTERIAEKPFLIYNEDYTFSVFVPDVTANSRGITWKNGLTQEKGKLISLNDFYIANALTDNSQTLNAALKSGKHLLFTPGIYELESPLLIQKENTVVMGLGYATLKIADVNADSAIKVGDVSGVRVADILVDAGQYSKNMVVVGSQKNGVSHADNPVVLSNIYLRIGGAENRHTETETAMVINSNDTIGDNFWIWRADHSRGVEWQDTLRDDGSIAFGNPAKTGIRVNGDNVLCYALMVEHFEDYQTYWAGENGKTVMYQSETPYYVPSQNEWTSYDGAKNGCASYKVDDSVNVHTAIGIGVYLVNWSGVTLDSAIEVPEKEGIDMQHLVTCCFASDNSFIVNVINGYGGLVGSDSFRRLVEKYPL